MWDDAKALHAVAVTLTTMALVALAAALVAWLARQPAFAIREAVVLTPLRHASAPHLEAAIREDVTGTFFTVDLDAARAAIGDVRWIRSVALRRQWPHRLEIEVEEHAPLARWRDEALVNTEGEIFAARYAGDLPRFDGPDGSAPEMAARYRAWSARLAPLSLAVTALTLSQRGGWSIEASDGIAPLTLVLGRDEPDARLARFAAGYTRTIGALARSGTRIDYVDLRYRNGFAARVPGFREKPIKKG
jgi:cell division protein FtsQ